ncbi:MAG: phage Gp37/Gp68 family protein [Pseudomonadota bacterium]
MGDTTIEWTEATWNPVTGCSKISPGCAHCYAEGVADRFWATQYPWVSRPSATGGPSADHDVAERPRRFTDVWCHPERLDQPLRRRKPTTYFVNSMSDLFHEDVPAVFIADVFATMAKAGRHTFQVLTKRPARMRELLSDPPPGVVWPLPNVWLGVSVESQRYADERIPILLDTPAALRFISAEPLLGPVVLKQQNPDGFWPPNAPQPDRAWLRHKDWPDDFGYWTTGLDWVIVGLESGAGARPGEIDWIRALVRQCQAGLVPVFVKQLGANPQHRLVYGPITFEPDQPVHVERLRLRSRKGGDPAEWPEDLRIREYPRPRT